MSLLSYQISGLCIETALTLHSQRILRLDDLKRIYYFTPVLQYLELTHMVVEFQNLVFKDLC